MTGKTKLITLYILWEDMAYEEPFVFTDPYEALTHLADNAGKKVLIKQIEV